MDDMVELARKISAKADLKKIIKYHPASEVYLNLKSADEYSITLGVKLVLHEVDGEPKPIDEYDYDTIINKNLPEQGHGNNLLVLVKHLIDIEWGYFTRSWLEDEDGKLVFNQQELMLTILKELRTLRFIQTAKSDTIVESKVKLKGKREGEKERFFDIANGVFKANEDDSKNILDLLIENRLNQLNNSEFPLFGIYHEQVAEWKIDDFDDAISVLIQPQDASSISWLFSKLVAESILNYLKGEMIWNQRGADLVKEQGIVIYTLLLVFNLVRPEVEKNLKSDRERIKYIHSLIRNDHSVIGRKLSFATFYHIDIEDFKSTTLLPRKLNK